MHTIIEWNDVESLQMFSGFRGSGKTTELFRLRQQLEDEGYLVLYCDALSYILKLALKSTPSFRVKVQQALANRTGELKNQVDKFILLLLFREALTRTKSLPVSEDAVESAIRSVRSQFMPIAVENARWLHQISRLRQTALMTDQPEDINRLARFLDTHFVLYLRNGDEWYDIHIKF